MEQKEILIHEEDRPKNCVLCEYKKTCEERILMCQFNDIFREQFGLGLSSAKIDKENCPIKTIEEHDKQVRKETAKEITKAILKINHKYFFNGKKSKFNTCEERTTNDFVIYETDIINAINEVAKEYGLELE